MEEKRKYPRTEIRRACLRFVGRFRHALRGAEYLARGRAIDVDNPAFVPQALSSGDGKGSSIVHECRVAWIQKNRIGLTFVKIGIREAIVAGAGRLLDPQLRIAHHLAPLVHLQPDTRAELIWRIGNRLEAERRGLLDSGWATILAISDKADRRSLSASPRARRCPSACRRPDPSRPVRRRSARRASGGTFG